MGGELRGERHGCRRRRTFTTNRADIAGRDRKDECARDARGAVILLQQRSGTGQIAPVLSRARWESG
ncbi:MAG: hypothetical protein KatS3mg108_3663 [Isosphaeraceae bacterium]|nr:MAG: hypothetical protein KatS3mg108_3663 [Isosphaeraceae bacterium]